MLGFVARFGSSKGMVSIPNLSGLTTAAATSVIQNAGLKFDGSSSSTTSSESLGDKVFSQSIPSGTLVEYETKISFGSYVYVPYVPTKTTGDCTNNGDQVRTTAPSDCIAGTTDRLVTITQARHKPVFFDNVFAGYYDPCSSITSTEFIPSVVACGYVPPAATCTAGCGSYSSWSACKILYSMGGERTRTRTCTRTNCSTYTETDSDPCCTVYCGPWSAWSGGAGAQSRSRTCVKADCSSYSESEQRCQVQSYTTCGACSKKSPFRKTCTTTTVNSSCTSSSSSSSVAC